jgi:arginine exporter protein ArgO
MDATSLTVFFKAALIGLLIAAPVGPIGLLTMQRTLERGLAAGLATGMGAAVADALYGAIGAFGVSWLIHALIEAKTPLALGGGAILLVLAWRTWRAPVTDAVAPARDARNLLGLAAGTFLLTLANPATIVSFIAVFGSLGFGRLVAAAHGADRAPAQSLHARLARPHQPRLGRLAGGVRAVAVGFAGVPVNSAPHRFAFKGRTRRAAADSAVARQG